MTPILSATPSSPVAYSLSMAETFSWIPVEGTGRPLYARATYCVNPPTITVSPGTITLGAIEIKDGGSALVADVEAIAGGNALRVLTQELESATDDVAIGDRLGNVAAIHQPLSALKVYITNPSLVHIPYSYTICETLTIGNPSFIPKQILLHNGSNSDVDVNLTLTRLPKA